MPIWLSVLAIPALWPPSTTWRSSAAGKDGWPRCCAAVSASRGRSRQSDKPARKRFLSGILRRLNHQRPGGVAEDEEDPRPSTDVVARRVRIELPKRAEIRSGDRARVIAVVTEEMVRQADEPERRLSPSEHRRRARSGRPTTARRLPFVFTAEQLREFVCICHRKMYTHHPV
jgi:hypothetical protein